MKRFGKPAVSLKLRAIAICCALAVLFFIPCLQALADESRQDTAITMVAKTLGRLGEKDLAKRFLDDYFNNGQVKIEALGGEGVNAETGPEGLFGSGKNVMTLDDSILKQADMKRIWEKRPYSKALDTVGWAVTVYHEYIHMDQKNPQNIPRDEDPAWQETDRAIARWCERLRNELDNLKNEPASGMKGDKLQELEDILLHLQSQSGLFKEAVPRNIRDGKLSDGLTWEYPGLGTRINGIIQDVRAEIARNKSALQTTTSDTGSSGGQASGVFPGEPFNGMQITYSVSGASITGSSDSHGFTTARTLSGDLGSGQLLVSGSAKMGNGFGADLHVTVSVDGDSKDFSAYIKSGFPGFNVQPFSVAVPIPAGAKAGSFSISMTGHYNVGTRGLVVSGSFEAPVQVIQQVSVLLNGKKLQFDVQPLVENGRTLVPLRKIAEALGCNIKWNAANKTILLVKGNTQVYLQVNSTVAKVNGKTKKLDVPPRITQGRTLLPLRFLAEALGLKVGYDKTSQTITISR